MLRDFDAVIEHNKNDNKYGEPPVIIIIGQKRFIRNYHLPNRFERFLSAKESLLRRRFGYNHFFMDRNELTDGNLILSNGLDRDLCRYGAGESCARDANRLQRFKGDNRRVLWLRFLICPRGVRDLHIQIPPAAMTRIVSLVGGTRIPWQGF